MKNIISFLIFLLPLFAGAQKKHTVGPKESLFSIGRLYNVHPRELASYNNIPFENGLTIGQVLKIPSKTTMAPLGETPAVTVAPLKSEVPKVAPVKKEPSKAATAIYHTVAKKEGLYGISKKYNVSIDDIKKWNNLGGDGLSEGMNLIVGYNGSSPVAPAAINKVPEKAAPVAVKIPDPQPVVVKETIKESPQPVKVEEVTKGSKDFAGGAFKSFYNSQVADKSSTEEKGIAGIFKSTSGWEDGKYYCLHNSAPAGTYIKITNNATQKSVYAKVLDLIPELKQNNGVIIRISNAAATALGSGAANFDCTLHF
jgi:LysM repeat protein